MSNLDFYQVPVPENGESSSQPTSNFEEELDLIFQEEEENPLDLIHDEIDEWLEVGNKAERKEKDAKYGKWVRRLDASFKTSATSSERNKKYFTDHNASFPSLCRIAEMVCATPGSSGSIERLFSKANDIMSSERNCMSTTTVEMILQVSSFTSVKSLFE